MRRDYEEAFRIMLDYEKATKPDEQEAEAEAEAEFYIGAFLQGGLEMMAYHDPQWSAWYLPEIQEKLPVDERLHVGMTWLRRAAYHGSWSALNEVSFSYHRGRYGLPYDEALAHCFEEAVKDKSKIEGCRQLEQIRDAARERESRLLSGERLSPH